MPQRLWRPSPRAATNAGPSGKLGLSWVGHEAAIVETCCCTSSLGVGSPFPAILKPNQKQPVLTTINQSIEIIQHDCQQSLCCILNIDLLVATTSIASPKEWHSLVSFVAMKIHGQPPPARAQLPRGSLLCLGTALWHHAAAHQQGISAQRAGATAVARCACAGNVHPMTTDHQDDLISSRALGS